MATLRKRTRGRLLTIFTVVAVIFSMGGAVPAEEPGEPAEPGIGPAVDTNVTGHLRVQDETCLGYGGSPSNTAACPSSSVELFVHEVSGSNTQIRLDNGGATDVSHDHHSWDIETFSGGFFEIENQQTSNTVFELHPAAPGGSLVVDDGENSMNQPLRVSANVGSGVTPSYVLENNGAPLFFYQNSATGDEFQFSLLSNGEFVISALGTGGPEFVVAPNGAVRMGPGASSTFILDPAGNLTITGNLTTAGGTLSASDAALQAQVEALELENQELESRLAELEVLVAALTG